MNEETQCCFGKLARSRQDRCKCAATWFSTFNGKRTGLVWCGEHKPATLPQGHGLKRMDAVHID